MTRFTGWHMTWIIVGFFAVVMAVNFLMATLAVRTFGGTVVDDSYTAGQKFNRWLDDARRQEAAGWKADIARLDAGHVRVTMHVPGGDASDLTLSGVAMHPLGRVPEIPLAFERHGDAFVTTRPLPTGRWAVRLSAGGPDGVRARFEQDLQP